MGLRENIKRRFMGNTIENQENKKAENQGRKYEFTGEQMEYEGVFGKKTLHRIRALRDIQGDIEQGIPDVKAGELGGWIEEEKNLSHEGKAWVADEAKVFNDSFVMDNARVEGNAIVHYDSKVKKNAKVFENARVEDSIISDKAKIHGNSSISAQSYIFGNAEIDGSADISYGVLVSDDAKICQEAKVQWNAKVARYAVIDGEAVVKGESEVYGHAHICDNALVTGKSHISGDTIICGEAIVAGGSKINHGTIDDAVIISGGTKVCDVYPKEKTTDKENVKENSAEKFSTEQQNSKTRWSQEESELGKNPSFSPELQNQQQFDEIDIEP